VALFNKQLIQNKHFFSRNQKFLRDLLVLSGLVSLTFILGYYVRPPLLELLYRSDDVYHISIALGFKENLNFRVDFLETWIFRSSFEELFQKFPTISYPESGKGPVFYVLLGSFYKLLGTTVDQFYLHASIFSNLVTSTFLIIFYYFVKKRFNFHIAVFSSFVILFVPFLVWVSDRALLYNLLFVFMISAIFFLNKKKSHYLMFGIFVGLAHLTHPFGMLLGVSYGIFLLINREFKGFLILIISWFALLTPWFIRNYSVFGDIGWGLYIPFSDKISQLISIIFPVSATSYSQLQFGYQSIERYLTTYSPFSIFRGSFSEFDTLYNMEFLVLFLLAFTGLAFLNFEKLREKKRIVIISIVAIFVLYISTNFILTSILGNEFYSSFTTTAFEIFLIFVFPVTSIILLKHKTSIFLKNIPRLHLFIMLFSLVILVTYTMSSAQFARNVPETKHLIFMLFLLLPLSILGFEKLIKFIPKHKFQQKSTLIILLTMISLIIYMGFGIESIKHYHDADLPGEEVKLVNKFIIENLPQNSNLSSNRAGGSFLYTGLSSIAIPTEVTWHGWEVKNSELEIAPQDLAKFFNHFKISHLIFYDVQKYYGKNLLDNLDNVPIETEIRYKKVKDWNDSYIFQVISVEEANIDYPFLYVKKAELLEREGKLEESKIIFNEIRNHQPESREMKEKLCIELVYHEKSDMGLQHCNNLLSKDSNDLVAHQSLPIYYQKTGQKDKVLEIFDSYERLFEEKSSYERVLESWSSTFSNLISLDKSYEKPLYKILDNAKKYYQNGEYSRANKLVDRIYFISGLSFDLIFDTYIQKIIIINRIGTYEEILATYDSLIEISYVRIEEYAQNNQYNKVNKLEDSLIITLNGKAAFLENQDDFHKSFYVYNEILNINQFDSQTHKKIAAYHEKYGKLSAALHHYEFALNLEPNNDYLSMKINELKEKLNN